MNVTFNHPPVPCSLNPFMDFKPNNANHYPSGSGVYIFGLKLQVDEREVFVPLYVGIAKDLKKRLFEDHFKQESYPGTPNSKKEIFDFSKKKYSLKEIRQRYSQMLIYDLATNHNTGVNQQPMVFYLNLLIWFQDSNIYNIKFNVSSFHGDSYHYKSVKLGGVLDSDEKFFKIKNDIIKTKKNFNDNYYFVYASLTNDIKSETDNEPLSEIYPKFSDEKFYNDKNGSDGIHFCERVELATKRALNIIGINTTAKAYGKIFDVKIDLNLIEKELVNLGGHPYNNNDMYISNLIIPVQK